MLSDPTSQVNLASETFSESSHDHDLFSKNPEPTTHPSYDQVPDTLSTFHNPVQKCRATADLNKLQAQSTNFSESTNQGHSWPMPYSSPLVRLLTASLAHQVACDCKPVIVAPSESQLPQCGYSYSITETTTLAVAADNAGNSTKALKLYKLALDGMSLAVKQDPPLQRNVLFVQKVGRTITQLVVPTSKIPPAVHLAIAHGPVMNLAILMQVLGNNEN